MAEQAITQHAEPGGDHPHRSRGDDQDTEEAQQQQQHQRADRRHGRRGRAAGQEAEDAAGGAHTLGPGRWRRDAVGQMRDPAGREGQRQRADHHPVGRRAVLGCPQQHEAEGQQDERHGIPDPPERAGDDRVDDVADHPVEAPPLPGSDDDGQADEGEPEPVPTVFGLELGGRCAHPAHRPTGDVRQAQPGAADRP
jgi:hypothetical protein